MGKKTQKHISQFGWVQLNHMKARRVDGEYREVRQVGRMKEKKCGGKTKRKL